mmetsp:Transcript_86197/g.241095  ORF Transcript_86197/g.241095 Transcript_86197/m.241095 type:complete len:181 (-) Transcript_86197:73-615(-)
MGAILMGTTPWYGAGLDTGSPYGLGTDVGLFNVGDVDGKPGVPIAADLALSMGAATGVRPKTADSFGTIPSAPEDAEGTAQGLAQAGAPARWLGGLARVLLTAPGLRQGLGDLPVLRFGDRGLKEVRSAAPRGIGAPTADAATRTGGLAQALFDQGDIGEHPVASTGALIGVNDRAPAPS